MITPRSFKRTGCPRIGTDGELHLLVTKQPGGNRGSDTGEAQRFACAMRFLKHLRHLSINGELRPLQREVTQVLGRA